MNIRPRFTDQQIADFHAYEKIRQSCVHNMFSQGAQKASGLTKKRMLFVMKNFNYLSSQANEES